MSVERSVRIPIKEPHLLEIEKCFDENGQITGDNVGIEGRITGKKGKDGRRGAICYAIIDLYGQ